MESNFRDQERLRQEGSFGNNARELFHLKEDFHLFGVQEPVPRHHLEGLQLVREQVQDSSRR